MQSDCVTVGGTRCCHQPMRHKVLRGSSHSADRNKSIKSTFFHLISFYFCMYVWPENNEELCYQDLLIYRLLRVLFNSEPSHFYNNVPIRAEKQHAANPASFVLSWGSQRDRAKLTRQITEVKGWLIHFTHWLTSCPTPLPRMQLHSAKG